MFLMLVISIILILKYPSFRNYCPWAEFKSWAYGEWEYWPNGVSKKAARSYIIRVIHFASIIIRCTSVLQYLKTFYKKMGSNVHESPVKMGDVPAWVVELYLVLWITYLVAIAYFIPLSEYLSRLILYYILIYRLVHIIYGNMHYGLFRSFYSNHKVHNPARNVVILILSYFEVVVVYALIYGYHAGEVAGYTMWE